jgi:hypothetical protein
MSDDTAKQGLAKLVPINDAKPDATGAIPIALVVESGIVTMDMLRDLFIPQTEG